MSWSDIHEDPNLSRLLGAQVCVMNQIFSFMDNMSPKCAVQLGIPDIIHSHGKPMALSELVTALKVHPSKSHSFYRLLCILCHSGFFSKEPVRVGDDDDNEGYVLTDSSRLLLSDSPFSMSADALTMLDPFMIKSWHYVPTWFQQSNDDGNNRTPSELAHGMSFWEYCRQEPTFNQTFQERMANDAKIVSTILINTGKEVFEGLNSLVDVGGSTGTMAMAIANAFPHLTCTVLDLPQVVGNLQDNGNLKYVAGSIFDAIPPADAVLLKMILHDWNDEECVKILKRCKDAIKEKEGGKVMIIDMVMGNGTSEDDELIETSKLYSDMLIMLTVGGQERNERQWAKLFSDAGFSGYKMFPILNPKSLIEVYP